MWKELNLWWNTYRNEPSLHRKRCGAYDDMDCHDTLQKIGSEVCMISVVIFVFLIGMCIASFAGLCADRLPVHKSVITGRSHCDHCDHVLAWYDLLPVAGYGLCKGKCR